MKIYVNGCSFTFGDELADPKKSSWPMLLGNHDIVNDAMSGGTNQRIVYKTIKNSCNNYDLYLIAWTTYTRYTFYKSDNNYETNFNPQLRHTLYSGEQFFKDWGKTLYMHWYNELYAFKLWLQQIIQLQNFLRGKNYLMINAFHNHLNDWSAKWPDFISAVENLVNFSVMNDEQLLDEYREIQYYINLIDTTKFYKWGEFYLSGLPETFERGPNGHFLEEGHIYVSNLIKNQLHI